MLNFEEEFQGSSLVKEYYNSKEKDISAQNSVENFKNKEEISKLIHNDQVLI